MHSTQLGTRPPKTIFVKNMENINSKIKSKESSVAEINEKITRLINEVKTSDDSSEDGDDD